MASLQNLRLFLPPRPLSGGPPRWWKSGYRLNSSRALLTKSSREGARISPVRFILDKAGLGLVTAPGSSLVPGPGFHLFLGYSSIAGQVPGTAGGFGHFRVLVEISGLLLRSGCGQTRPLSLLAPAPCRRVTQVCPSPEFLRPLPSGC